MRTRQACFARDHNSGLVEQMASIVSLKCSVEVA